MTDRLPRVLALVAEADGPAAWRIFQPFAALTARGYPAADWEWKDHPLLGELVVRRGYDAVVLPRLSWNDADEAAAVRWAAALHRAGLATIYEVDDDLFSPWVVRQQRQAGLEAARGKSDTELDAQRLARIRALQRCDGVTVSSSRLATVVRQYVTADVPVCVVPNAIDWQWHRAVLDAWRTAARTAARVKPALVPPGNTVTIGWAGGARPDADVAVMAQSWAVVGAARPQTRFVVQGYHPAAIDDALRGASIAPERVEWRPWLPLEQYPAGLAGAQITCAPLADAPFNRAKTPIKVLEAAALGAAVVASPTVYGAVIEDGRHGALCHTVEEWTAALLRLVDEPRTRRQWARALRHQVEKHHTLDGNLWRWPAAWQTILEAFRRTHTRRLLAG